MIKQDVCCAGGIDRCLGFRFNCEAMDMAGVLAMVGEDEQATGGTADPAEEGKTILETLRIFGLALRGPRSCCTANSMKIFTPMIITNPHLPSLFILTRKHRANRQDRH